MGFLCNRECSLSRCEVIPEIEKIQMSVPATDRNAFQNLESRRFAYLSEPKQSKLYTKKIAIVNFDPPGIKSNSLAMFDIIALPRESIQKLSCVCCKH